MQRLLYCRFSIFSLTLVWISFRWSVLRKTHAFQGLCDHARPLPADLWEAHGWAAVHPCADGRDVLGSSHLLSHPFENFIDFCNQTHSHLLYKPQNGRWGVEVDKLSWLLFRISKSSSLDSASRNENLWGRIGHNFHLKGQIQVGVSSMGLWLSFTSEANVLLSASSTFSAWVEHWPDAHWMDDGWAEE